LNSFTIIIPFHSKDPYRQKAYEYVLNYYKRQFPEAKIITASGGGELYSKSKAINRAVLKSNTHYLAIIDGDIICPKEQIMSGLRLLDHSPLVIPYTDVIDLTKQASQKLYTGSDMLESSVKRYGKKRSSKNSMPVGGINLIKRSCFLKVKGFDERFIGWGGEDDAFVATTNTICGPSKRLAGPVYHLWHPSTRYDRNPFYRKNYAYTIEYFKAINNVEKMKEILAKRKDL
jgi:N-terminal domain of galactosyltransferase